MTENVSPEMVERMAIAIRRHCAGFTNIRQGYTVEAEFRAIAAELPAPVDPDLAFAREIIADAVAYGAGSAADRERKQASDFRDGDCDAGNLIDRVVKALRGRTLATQGDR